MSQISVRIEKSIKKKQKMLAVLVDPDKTENLNDVLKNCNTSGVDVILTGGSLITKGNLSKTIQQIRKKTKIPIIIFPGDSTQICNEADAILLLSLVSGRNPDLLIGQHVNAAHALKKSGLEILPVGYLLVESEKLNTAVYVSQTLPVPRNKPEIATATALAAEQLGMKYIYLDGGSGAQGVVPAKMIQEVKKEISIPLIVGGGMREKKDVLNAWKAGADIVVIGTVAEEDPSFILQFKK